jgi:carbamoyltransferase
MKDSYILGTSLSHDGSSCLMKNGRILVAIEKERLSRKKHDGFNDDLTIDYCLISAGITMDDVDLIVEESTLASPELKPFEKINIGVRKYSNTNVRKIQISHHLAHAYAAIGLSPYDKAAIIVMDGQGSSLLDCIDSESHILPCDIKNIPHEKKHLYWEKESLYSFDGLKMVSVFKDFSKFLLWDRELFPAAPIDIEHSIAQFYGGTSYYVFDEQYCEGKLMGLAPYGSKETFKHLDAFEFNNGRVFLKTEWMKCFPLDRSGRYKSLFSEFKYYADIARWAQDQIENAILYIFHCYAQKTTFKNVAYSGGLAMNAVANTNLLQSKIFDSYFFLPPATDCNLSIGCCYYGWVEVLHRKKIMHDGSIYFGRKYCISSKLASKSSFPFMRIDWNNNKVLNVLAQKIADSKIVAIFLDGAEFGQRALGHRSILADPRSRTISNYINRKVKNREDFRPFAPSVLSEKVEEIFNCIGNRHPYMITIADVREKWKDKIPAITHIDGSARIQTVHEDISPEYYKLIRAFCEITEVPVLLNTSLNGRGMPIIETPEEAISFFQNTSGLDLLIINDFVFAKNIEDINELKKVSL